MMCFRFPFYIMKNNLFLLAFLSAALVSPAAAENITVSGSEALVQAWAAAEDGSTVTLADSCTLSDEVFASRPDVSVTLNGGGNALVWAKGASVTLPEGMILENAKVTGAPAGVLSGNVRIGSLNTFENNSTPIRATLLESGSGNVWQSNMGAGNGGAILVEEGGTATITGDNSFTENHACGMGGAIRVESGARLTLSAAGEERILFAGNTQSAAVDANGTVAPGVSNDISLGDSARLTVDASEKAEVSLSGGVASDTEDASIVKTGTGKMVLGGTEDFAGSMQVQGGSVEQAAGTVGNAKSLTLAAGTSYLLNEGACLSAPLSMQGAEITVAGTGAALLSPAVTLTGNNTWNFVMSDALLGSSDTVLSLAPGLVVRKGADGALTLNIDLRTTTSAESAGTVNLLNTGDLTDAATKETLGSAPLTVTDKNGAHTTTQHLHPDGTVDMQALLQELGTLRFDRPGRAAANALWSSAGALKTFAAAAQDRHPVLMEKATEIWGLGMAFSDKMSDSFTYSGGGYAIGASTACGDNMILGIAFGQMFGTNKAKFDTDSDADAHNKQREIMLGLHAAYAKKLSATTAWQLQAALAYGNTDNDYSTATHSGSWTDNNFYASLRATWQYRQEDGTCIAPFIGLEWLAAAQRGASFSGQTPWSADGADLNVLSLPVGVAIHRSFEMEGGSIFTPSLEIAYRGDLARTNPDVHATDGQASWTAKGCTPGRNALEVRGMLHLQITGTWSLYGSYSLETRSDSTLQRYTVGTTYAF